MAPHTAWTLTTGEEGMRTQARGLATAVADVVVEQTLRRGPLDWLPGRQAPFAPPWPDILISCGRRSVWASRAIRKAAQGRTVTVHIQDPKVSAKHFDLVVAMAHDRIAAGGNVTKVETALHDLTPQKLAIAVAAWRDRLKLPFVGVLVGGDTARGQFSPEDQNRLISGLMRLRRDGGTALAITGSRRTPPAFLHRLRETFTGDPAVFVWDGQGDKPYLGILGLADALVVTGDSVSMISEALAAGAPVEVLDLNIPAYRPFLDRLIQSGHIRSFTGEAIDWPSAGPLNATLNAAETVKSVIDRRVDLGTPTGTGRSNP